MRKEPRRLRKLKEGARQMPDAEIVHGAAQVLLCHGMLRSLHPTELEGDWPETAVDDVLGDVRAALLREIRLKAR